MADDGTDFRSGERTDQELIAGVEAGDMAAFTLLYERYRDWIVRLAWRFTGNETDALDVLQETFKYVLTKLVGSGDFKLTASMTTFLYPAVRNLSLAARRKRVRFVGVGQPEEQEGPGLATEAQGVFLRAELARVMAALPEAQREVVLMRFVDDMKLDEIAAALGVPLGTVKSRLHHALAALRDDPRTRAYFAPSKKSGLR